MHNHRDKKLKNDFRKNAQIEEKRHAENLAKNLTKKAFTKNMQDNIASHARQHPVQNTQKPQTFAGLHMDNLSKFSDHLA